MPKLRVGMAYLVVGLLFTMLTSTSKSSGEKIRTIDSLKNVIETADHACPEPCRGDTTKIKALNQLGWTLMYSNPDTAILLGKQALALSEKTDDIKNKTNSFSYLGTFL
ncbi:MAG: hypothetical protein ABII90_07170 [Bacteroidota bacterium]